MKASQVLKKYGWCQGDMAIDEYGNKTPATSSKAESFCALGAITKAYGWHTKEAGKAIQALKKVVKKSIMKWNDADCANADEVIAAMRKAGI